MCVCVDKYSDSYTPFQIMGRFSFVPPLTVCMSAQRRRGGWHTSRNPLYFSSILSILLAYHPASSHIFGWRPSFFCPVYPPCHSHAGSRDCLIAVPCRAPGRVCVVLAPVQAGSRSSPLLSVEADNRHQQEKTQCKTNSCVCTVGQVAKPWPTVAVVVVMF